MRTTTAINFYCRPSKARVGKNGSLEAPIEISLIINGERTYLQTNQRCDPKLFSTKMPKNIRKYVDSLRVNIVATISEMVANGMPLNAQSLKKCVQLGGVFSYSIKNLFDDYETLLNKKVRNGQIKEIVARRYKYIRTLFEKHIDFNRETTDITPAIIENFFLDLKPNYEESSLAGMMTRLKTIIKYGIANNHIKIDPFQNIKVNKHQKDITYLTEEELKRIYELEIDNKSLSDVRDMFILQASTGMAYTDVANLKKEDIKIQEDGTHYISKARQKTGVKFTTIVLPMGVEILKRHNYELRVISNQKTNAMLKTIQILAGIETTMTTHLARRTFATHLLKSVRVEIVSKALGHSNIKQTLSAYAKVLDTNVISELKAVAK